MKTHELKTETRYFNEIITNAKQFEMRKNDREFEIGDILILKDYNGHAGKYRDGYIIARIKYILEGPEAEAYGLKAGFAILGFNII